MPKKILVIDDNEEIRVLLKFLLTREGLTVETAEDGLVGLNHLGNSTSLPDVIILDLIMPGMDGYQFREAQIRDPRISAIPVIVMTANQMHDETKKLGVSDCIRKPIPIEELITCINKVTQAS